MKDIDFKTIFAELFPERWDAANNAPSDDFEYYIAKLAFEKGYAFGCGGAAADAPYGAPQTEKKRAAKKSAAEAE